MGEDNKNISKEELARLSTQEKAELLQELLSSEDLDEVVFNDLLSSINEDINTNPDEDYTSVKGTLNEMQDILENNPALKRKYKESKVKNSTRDVLSLFNSVIDLAESKNQIEEGQLSSGSSKKPATPKRYELDPAVSRSINESLRGIDPASIESQINPVKQDIKDTYNASLNTAKLASGGQSGSFGSMAQANINQRYRNLQNLGALRQQLKDSSLRNLNYSLQNRLQERNLQQRRDLNVYGNELSQYNAEQNAAGNLERAGRINRRSSRRGVLNNILPLTDKLIDNSAPITDKLKEFGQQLFNKSVSPTINDPMASKLPSTNFDSFNHEEYDTMMNEIDSNLILNPLRGSLIRR